MTNGRRDRDDEDEKRGWLVILPGGKEKMKIMGKKGEFPSPQQGEEGREEFNCFQC